MSGSNNPLADLLDTISGSTAPTKETTPAAVAQATAVTVAQPDVPHPEFLPGGTIQTPGTSPITASAPAPTADTRPMGTGDVVDPFTIGPTIRAQNQTAVERAKRADDVLTATTSAIDARQEQRLGLLTTAVAAKTDLGRQVADQTTAFRDSVTPIFQRREAIASRMVEYSNMNPFKRALTNLVSFGNDEESLKAKDDALAHQLGVMGAEYQTNMGAANTMLQTIDTQLQGQDSILTLQDANDSVDFQLASQGVGSAQTMFQTSLQGLSAENEIMRGKAQARIDLLSGMQPAQINAALADARKKGGTTIVNGVELRAGELQEASMSWQDKELALQSRQLAIQSQRMDLAAQQEVKIINSMTGPELDAAIQAGGIYRGQRLNQIALTQAYGAMRTRQGLIVDQAGQAGAPALASSMLTAIGGRARQAQGRALSLFGQIPGEMDALDRSLAARMNSYAEGQRAATRAGAGAAYAEANLPAFQAMLKEQQDTWAKMAKKWSGGNADLEAVGLAVLSGSPLNSEQATRGLITMARGGIPAGTKLSGPAAATMARVKALVTQYDAGKPGDDINSLMSRVTGKKPVIDPELIARVQKEVVRQQTSTLMDSVLQATPAIAAQIMGPDGKPHPFSQVNPQDFLSSVHAGDEEGYRRVGQMLGLKPDQTRTLFSQGTAGPMWAQVVKKDPSANFAQLGQQLAALQNQSTLQHLDASPSATATFKPSKAYADLMMSPQYQQAVSRAAQGQMQSSAGDYIVGSIAGQGFDSSFYNYAQSVPRSYAALEARSIALVRERQARIRSTNPWDSTNVALGTIQGISPKDQQSLVAAVRQVVEAGAAKHPESPGNILGPGRMPDSPEVASLGRTPGYVTAAMIDSVMLNHQFDDPNLERIRKTAARDWVTTRAVTDSALERLRSDTGYDTIGLDAGDR